MTLDQIALHDLTWLAVAFLIVATLYSMVGHGGGSGYLAVMALAGFAPHELRPTALSLNVLVSTIALIRFTRAKAFTPSLFWPFVLASVPCAFIGGLIELDPTVYKIGLGVVLLVAAYRLFLHQPKGGIETTRALPIAAALVIGSVIGLVSGLIGVGGGIFLSPILLLAHWATARQTAGITAAFILANSMAALLGVMMGSLQGDAPLPFQPVPIAVWGAAVALGGFIGSGIGSRRLGHIALRRMLAVVLVIAAGKMFLPTSADTPPTAPPDPSENTTTAT